MGILGKLLLVVNLLLGGGFTYLALQDWKGRQTIEAAGFRHVILRDGLPLGDLPTDPTEMPSPAVLADDPDVEIPFRIIGPGNKPTKTVSAELLKKYFEAAGGSGVAGPDGQVTLASNLPIPNQLAEVNKTYGLVRGLVERQDGPAQKAQIAGPILLRLAESYDERVELLQLLKAGNGDALAGRLFKKFEQVIKATSVPDVTSIAPTEAADADTLKDRLKKADELRSSGTKDQPERRARIAHLLVHLDESAAWQKRVLMVVGAKAYARALAVQSIRVREMLARVEKEIVDDQDQFVAEYAALRRLAIQRSQEVRDAEDSYTRLAAQEQKDADIVTQRKTHLADLVAHLERVREEVNQLLARQTLTEEQLFGVQQEVATTLADIYKKQAELVETEKLIVRKKP